MITHQVQRERETKKYVFYKEKANIEGFYLFTLYILYTLILLIKIKNK